VVSVYVVDFWVATPYTRVGHYRRFGNLLFSYFQYNEPDIDAGRSSETLVTAGENMYPPPPRCWVATLMTEGVAHYTWRMQ